MGKAIFISFDHGDASQVNGLRTTLTNKNHRLGFLDRSLQEPVRNAQGRPIMLQPTDPSAEKVRQEIRSLLDQSSRLLVLIGQDTHSSNWVQWEIKEFLKEKRLGGSTQRVLCMRLKGNTTAGAPAIVREKGITVVNWDLNYLAQWAGS